MSIIIKTEEQIEGIRKSCHLAADALEFITPFVKDGVTTESINRELETFIRDHGAIPAPLGYFGYPKATCISINEVICHGIPSEQITMSNGDIVNIDVTTILNGYYGDTSRMYAVGEVSEEARKLMSVTQDCLAVGISQVRPGKQFGCIPIAITQYAVSRGYAVVHQFVGHGVGLDFHEEPQVYHSYDPRYTGNHTIMQPGMIFTIEPMINQGVAEAVIDEQDKWTARTRDGMLSAQYEHTVLVTEGGVEVLTK